MGKSLANFFCLTVQETAERVEYRAPSTHQGRAWKTKMKSIITRQVPLRQSLAEYLLLRIQETEGRE